MMKTNVFIITIGLMLLLLTSATSIDASPTDMPMHGPNGFNGESPELNITGSVNIMNSGINLSITVQPGNDFMKNMHDQMDRQNGDENGEHNGMGNHGMGNRSEQQPPYNSQQSPMMNGSMDPDDFSNQMSILLYQLVEFVDVNNDGYNSSDPVISKYNLNITTLNKLDYSEKDNMGLYIITSKDNVFRMVIMVNLTNNVPHDWKWSVDINYPHTQSNTSIAMLHELQMNKRQVSSPQYPMYYHYRNDSIMDHASPIKLRFKWDQYAFVDGINKTVEVNRVNNTLAISIPMGDNIEYDPNLGLEDTDFNTLIAQIQSFISTNFADTILSPTAIGLTITGLFVILVVIVFKIRYNNKI